MARPDASVSLSALARLGFVELTAASADLTELSELTGIERAELADGMTAADPDAAVAGMLRIARRDPAHATAVLQDAQARAAAWRVFGVSTGIADFFARRPEQLEPALLLRTDLPGAAELTERMLRAVDAQDGFAAASHPEEALRVAYRRCLAEIIAADLAAASPAAAVSEVSEALADAAAAALEAALAVARTAVSDAGGTAAR